jgi:hypothetical protein
MQLLGAKIVKTYTASAFHGLFDSEVLQQVRKFNMDKAAVKDLIYGGVNELIHNGKYYYHSSVGPEYCHFTDVGKVALSEFMNQMAVTMYKVDAAELDKRAKDMVINGLKGEL